MPAGLERHGLVAVHDRRLDIDGLRAVAVLGVIAFHFGIPGVSGGYTGVDVFFVISGFLIAGIIARQVGAGKFSLAQFYARRARRILPAVTVMSVVTTLAALWWLLPEDLIEYGRSALSVATFSSNFHFARRTDYFGGDADEMPLLHTWSLGIEEQFYVVFPLAFAWLMARGRVLAAAALGVVAVASWTYGAANLAERPEVAFFSTLSRIWELLAGALLALVSPAINVRRPLREALALAGLVLLGVAYVQFDRDTTFPGAAALVPCAGAVLVIFSGTAGPTLISRALSVPMLTGIGLISYSLYLWHWPILAFARYRLPEAFGNEHIASAGLATALFALTMALGYASWRWVEQPFRVSMRLVGAQQTLRWAALAIVVVSISSLALYRSDGLKWRWPEEVSRVSVIGSKDHGGRIAGCEKRATEASWPSRTCRVGAADAPARTLVWGDSHARRLTSGIVQTAGATTPALIVTHRPGCPPLLGVETYGRTERKECIEFSSEVLDSIARGDFKTVILVARWSYYAEGTRYGREGGPAIFLSEAGTSANARIVAEALERTIMEIRKLGAEVIIVGPTPEQKFHVTPTMLKTAAWNGPVEPVLTRAEMMERHARIFAILDEISRAGKATVLYPHQLLCDASSCPYQLNGDPLYVDNDHLSSAGLRVIAPVVADLVTRIQ